MQRNCDHIGYEYRVYSLKPLPCWSSKQPFATGNLDEVSKEICRNFGPSLRRSITKALLTFNNKDQGFTFRRYNGAEVDLQFQCIGFSRQQRHIDQLREKILQQAGERESRG